LVSYASSLDTPGILARSVDDCALMLNIISGPDVNDATCSTKEKEDYFEYKRYAKSLSDVTIGVPMVLNILYLCHINLSGV
jgi:aspartyl-tRNA(Asn)/glutamyl-tRNA(Gln) amidotransferase subunit A